MKKELIDKARDVNLIDLIINENFPYVQGHNHIKIICPFHDERTPSLAIYEDSYYCYACAEKGDAIEWVKKYYKISFTDAVKLLLQYKYGR